MTYPVLDESAFDFTRPGLADQDRGKVEAENAAQQAYPDSLLFGCLVSLKDRTKETGESRVFS